MNTIICIIAAAVVLAFLFFILPELLTRPKPPSGTEPGYYIRRRSDGYPLHVGGEAYDRARRTGDYTLEGESGRRVPIGQEYTDERLN